MNQDIRVIEGLQKRLDKGLLETLIYIEQNPGEFTIAELRSYFRVIGEFRLLFSPA
jgi:hypothetical protein